MQLLVHSSGAAGALGLYQLERRRLTIETIHSNFAAAGAVLRCSHAPANHFATCKWCTDTVPARTSSLTSEMCVVKCFCGRSSTNSVGMSSANKMFQLTGQAATTHTITITKPNFTAHSLPCTHLHPCLATSLPQWLRVGPHRKHVVSSPPTTLPPLCHSGSSRRSRASPSTVSQAETGSVQ